MHILPSLIDELKEDFVSSSKEKEWRIWFIYTLMALKRSNVRTFKRQHTIRFLKEFKFDELVKTF